MRNLFFVSLLTTFSQKDSMLAKVKIVNPAAMPIMLSIWLRRKGRSRVLGQLCPCSDKPDWTGNCRSSKLFKAPEQGTHDAGTEWRGLRLV